MVFQASSANCSEMSPDAQVSHVEGDIIYLADDVPHLLSMDDVWGVDDSCIAGSIHLSGLLVLSLHNRKALVNTDYDLTITATTGTDKNCSQSKQYKKHSMTQT